MGINGLWDVIGDGEIIKTADYAARHFQRNKRPLRIAVDEACWRFTNLTPEQVEAIRNKEPAANPVEKTILWRCLQLMKLNVQLLFVYDGLRKPWKRNKGSGGRVHKEVIKLLHQLFDHLKIPYHQAPGEAEAECAKLQQLGVVDAVWSDDGDALMFGCTTLIKAHKAGRERQNDYIKVFDTDILSEKLDFDRDSFMLFAILAGGDYDTTGLRGCGPQTALLVAKREYSLAKATRHVQQHQLDNWREALRLTLRVCNKNVNVPTTFPDFKALGHYRDPAVSTDEQARNLRGLRQGWDRPIEQMKLRTILRLRFHFDTRQFIKHMSHVFLAKALARANTPQACQENLQYTVQLKRTRKLKKDEGTEPPAKIEKKITFLPAPALEIDLSQRPEEEDWDKHAKDGVPYDPMEKVECEILDCLLQHGLPVGALDVEPETPRRKRKSAADAGDGTSGSTRKKPKVKASGSNATEAAASSSQPEGPKKRGRPAKKSDAEPGPSKAKKQKRKKGDEVVVEERPRSPSPQFRQPRWAVPNVPDKVSSPSSSAPSLLKPTVLDLCDSEDDEGTRGSAQCSTSRDVASRAVGGPSSSYPGRPVGQPIRLQPEIPESTVQPAFSGTDSPLFVSPAKPLSQRDSPSISTPSTTGTNLPAVGRTQSPLSKSSMNPASSSQPVSEPRRPQSRAAVPTPPAKPAASPPLPQTKQSVGPRSHTPLVEPGMVPGEAIDATALRELRMRSMLLKQNARAPDKQRETIPSGSEIIDLT